MPIPSYPVNLIPRPFAANGTFQIIPDAKSSNGRASWQEGFPVETQLPLSNGGIAPTRPDFNGIFNMLSALGYWQQAGGLMIYSQAQDYNTPAMVFYNGMLYFCKAPNGPDTTIGVVYPDGAIAPSGVDFNDYWMSFLDFLAYGSGGSGGGGGGFGGSFGIPIGGLLDFYGKTAPIGFLWCDGSTYDTEKYPKLFEHLGSATLPDMRGLVSRAYDPSAVRDPDGASRNIGSVQGDAMRQIQGTFSSEAQFSGGTGAAQFSGPFYMVGANGNRHIHSHVTSGNQTAGFDNSRVTPVADENRMVNMSVLRCIRAA